MGAEPWDCFSEFDQDVEALLQRTRKREFDAGKYEGFDGEDWCEKGDENYGKGPRHRSIDEAREAGDADGTKSILDITTVSLEPSEEEFRDPLVAYPLSKSRLTSLFGSEKPTASQVMANHDVWDLIERGTCLYIPVFENANSAKPSGMCWIGYSFD